MSRFSWFFLSAVMLASCSEGGGSETDSRAYPEDRKRVQQEDRGRLTGEGLTLFGGDKEKRGGASPIGVNAYLWRATLDTLAFLPLLSADPFGGVVLTDWYEDPATPGERFKITALILDQALRADAIKISLFKQARAKNGEWRDAEANPSTAEALENAILTRARQFRVQQAAE